MVQVSSEYISIGCNRTAHAACWGNDGLVAFGANALVALYSPLVSLTGSMKDVAIVSGSADKTAKIWKQDSFGKWINSATLEGHTDAVVTIATMHAHSVEGVTDLIITGSSDGTIRVWERREVDGNTALTYLPNTKTSVFASGHTDKIISIYAYQQDVKQFKKLHSLQGHDNWVRDLSFASFTKIEGTQANNSFKEGDLILSSASQDRYIRLWKISPHTEALSSKEKKKDTDTLLMGHDDWVLSVEWQKPYVQEETGRLIQPLRLLSASADKSMMVWAPDQETGVWVNEVRMGDIGGSTSLGFCGALFSPDGRSIVSHGANGAFHFWKNQSENFEDNNWAPEVAISGHFRSVENLAWDPKARYLLSVSLDQTTRLFAPWNRQISNEKVTTWHEIGRPQIHGFDLKCIAFVHDWQIITGADEKVLRVFDAPKSCVETLAALTQDESMLSNIEKLPVGANLPALGLSNKAVFAGDNVQKNNNPNNLGSHTVASATAEELSQVSDHPPFEETLIQGTLWPEVDKLYGHLYELVSVHATYDGKYIASSSKAASAEHAVVRLFSTDNWKEIKAKIEAHSLTVTSVAFSHNDHWLLTVSRDRLWSLSERTNNPDEPYKLVAITKAHARIIWDASWSHDDKLFATGSRDKTLKIWAQIDKEQPAKWECVATIKCTEAVTAVDFAPASVDNNVDLENISKWELYCNFEESLCHFGVVNSLKWRPITGDSGLLQLASAGEDQSVRLFNLHI
ncbi:WD40-repeat-containing domain protein [Mycotypha africana]|uniref:WD40-repeat-containing domain protein n=1 Tax=Mycotypha africana TaxID=64632 RepID=UPI002301B506|nr:WD40-repeat-containing domain protein [Mycotypha africana]KAI8984320.1 WD40-repeat-containing domain protein [Mycotypha africana]